jgi:hypothetical protein
MTATLNTFLLLDMMLSLGRAGAGSGGRWYRSRCAVQKHAGAGVDRRAIAKRASQALRPLDEAAAAASASALLARNGHQTP